MFPSGGTLVKLLAVVTALMTVTTGVPHVRCVCPDGRVKFFCPGPAASDCCCNDSSAPASGGAERDCCTREAAASSLGSSANGPTRAVESCGCERTATADSLAPAKGADDESRAEAAGSGGWEGGTVSPGRVPHITLVERRLPLPPPDLVLIHCHFTC